MSQANQGFSLCRQIIEATPLALRAGEIGHVGRIGIMSPSLQMVGMIEYEMDLDEEKLQMIREFEDFTKTRGMENISIYYDTEDKAYNIYYNRYRIAAVGCPPTYLDVFACLLDAKFDCEIFDDGGFEITHIPDKDELKDWERGKYNCGDFEGKAIEYFYDMSKKE